MKKELFISISASLIASSCNKPDISSDKGKSDQLISKTHMNYLIIMADQVRWDALGCSGNPHVKTPNLDALAAEGAYFTQAICPVPVSGPSRSCMLTGRMMEKTMIRTNPDADNGTSRYDSYDNILADNGYYLEYIGKFHSPLNMTDDYHNPPQYDMHGRELIRYWQKLYRYYLGDNLEVRPIKQGEILLSDGFYNHAPYVPYELDARYDALLQGSSPESLKKMKYSQPDCHGTLQIDDNMSITAFQARETIAALKRAQGKDFAITCSFHSPHAPMLPTPEYQKMYDPKTLPVPANIDDDMSDNPYRGGNGRLDKTEYADHEMIQKMTADYYALIAEVDHWVGEILRELEKIGEADDTMVIFLADHGEMLGSHGMREKNNFLEESVRVPLIMKGPSIQAGTKVTTPVSCLNIFPTLLDYAGLPCESDGYSMKGLIEGEKSKYDFAISEWPLTTPKTPNLMVRTNEWKLMVNINNVNGTGDALYDLKNDPLELDNLIYGGAHGKYREICFKLMTRLKIFLSDRQYPQMKALEEKTKKFR